MKKMIARATRLIRSGQRLVHEAAIRLGLAGYRAPFIEVTGDWDDGYAVGEHDHYGSLCERPRYAVLYGYLGARDRPVSILDVGCGVGLFRRGLPDERVDRFVCHPGDTKIVESIERSFGLDQGSLDHERGVLTDHGNMSAPTVLFILKRAIAKGLPARAALVAMGPGFTASCLSLVQAV